ncbi:Peptidyl-prolyl cis-trans isomerase PpiD [Labilithrix luteola]|uniref:Peptidyl-prolyl cis-trans isomerase PpiD n=1 Tax=Labilithrix luteola TaxID=1391654 RepID=A0A0K1Q7P4_9BACT|nr:peptidylprolyl isomerase [Labilithrix luteola]AKV01836.1 Peptidyl-prolyl cis-trans isomerase PpiD [Labilithrix luteola]
MSDNVQRTASILVGALVVGLVGWIAVNQTTPHAPHAPNAEGDAGAALATTASAAPVASAAPLASASAQAAAPAGDGGADLTLDSMMFDSGVMPSSAPRTVHLGVVLVQFTGAEGASSTARSKKEALEYARKLAEDAKTDFKHAVREGDSGSSEDIGKIPRGVLDPRTEVSVFSLAAGEMSDVLETPRGYWIVKRID